MKKPSGRPQIVMTITVHPALVKPTTPSGQTPSKIKRRAYAAPDFHKTPRPYVSLVPFLSCMNKSKLDKSFSDIYDILSKSNVNLPLLDVIRNMLAFPKFFKELNTYKCKYQPREKNREKMTCATMREQGRSRQPLRHYSRIP
ncbi:uncharacterized protein Pyn_36520 [Prunus yedoensis var. nudiflora]|uniref:Uncharacterized protein n=1 Tax=Prunus yedoensis var. nudiflora TaxID=2094558 RepID=A0A314ZRW9_PRUYE|nr:uncharacterized protein Pyn_36520 [Prunus yedoensis var. nudiflora]